MRHSLSKLVTIALLVSPQALRASEEKLWPHHRALLVISKAEEALGAIRAHNLSDLKDEEKTLREILLSAFLLRDRTLSGHSDPSVPDLIEAQEKLLARTISPALQRAMDASVEGLRPAVVRAQNRLAGTEAFAEGAIPATIGFEKEVQRRRWELQHEIRLIKDARVSLPAEMRRREADLLNMAARFERHGLSSESEQKVKEILAQFEAIKAEILALDFDQPESDAFADRLRDLDHRLRICFYQPLLSRLDTALGALAGLRAQFDEELARGDLPQPRRDLLQNHVKRQFALMLEEWQDLKVRYTTEEGAAEIKKIADEIQSHSDGPFYESAGPEIEKLQRRAFMIWLKSTQQSFHAYTPQSGSDKTMVDLTNGLAAVGGGFATILGGFFGFLWALNSPDYAVLKVMGPMLGGGAPLWSFVAHHGLARHRNKKSRARLATLAAATIGVNVTGSALCEFKSRADIYAQALAEARK